MTEYDHDHVHLVGDLAVVTEYLSNYQLLCQQHDIDTYVSDKPEVEIEGFSMFGFPGGLLPGQEESFLQFLYTLGKTLPGKVLTRIQVWWPMCPESGPQWWELDELGNLYVTESEIVPGERKQYEVTHV